MSQNHSVLTLSVKASAALSANTFVTATGAVATAAGNALGVARSDAVSGDLCPVDVLGTAKVIASAAISAGAHLEVASGGKAVTQTSGKTVGIALEEAGEANDVIEVLLIAN